MLVFGLTWNGIGEMKELIFVGLGGFVGAISRYGLSELVDRSLGKNFPAGTLTVNVLGCLVIGLLMALVEAEKFTDKSLQFFLITGLLGSLTTFSTFGHQSLQLLRRGSISLALLNVLCNVCVGLLAVYLGWLSVRFFAS
jgi:fluoride exporter